MACGGRKGKIVKNPKVKAKETTGAHAACFEMPPASKRRKSSLCVGDIIYSPMGSPRYVTRLYLKQRRNSGLESIGPYFSSLPPEMLNLLLSYLDAPALSCLGATCHNLHSCTSSMWKLLCKRLRLVHVPTVLCVAQPLDSSSLYSYDKAVECCYGEGKRELMAIRNWLYSRWKCVVCFRNCSQRVDVHFDVTLCDTCHPLFYRRKCHAKEQFSLTEKDLRSIDNDSYEFLVSDLISVAREKYGSKNALEERLHDRQKQKNRREADKQCALVERERQVVHALESQNSSYKDIAGVDARCMPFVSTPVNYQHAPQQSAEDAAKWLIAWKNRQETRHKSLLAEISARASRCKGCRARLGSSTKCNHVSSKQAELLIDGIKDHFHHDVVHYSRHGQLSLETGVYDLEHRSAQELFMRNERRIKLTEQLDAHKDEWPDILKGEKDPMNCSYAQDYVYKGIAVFDADGNKCRLRRAKDVARVILAQAKGWDQRLHEVKEELAKKKILLQFEKLKIDSHLLVDDFVDNIIVFRGDQIVACSASEVAERIAVIEGVEEERKSSAAERCARIYAECNPKPDLEALRDTRRKSLLKCISIKSSEDGQWETKSSQGPFQEFVNCGTTTSLFGYKLTTPEAAAKLIELKKSIYS